MIEIWPKPAPGAAVQLCTVKYLRPEPKIDSTEGVVILLAIKDGPCLKLYAHCALSQQIMDHDREYVEDLVKDLASRRKTDPDEVFEQLSNLSVGPIITGQVGWVESHKSLIEEHYPDFCLCQD